MGKYFLALMLLTTCLGCYSDIKPKCDAKYTVWIGTASFATGHDTDSYQSVDGMIVFTSKRTGKGISTPITSIYKITRNQSDPQSGVVDCGSSQPLTNEKKP